MGLDMYLTAKRYLWKDSDAEIVKKINDLIEVEADLEQAFTGSSLRVKGIEVSAMYWRKANAIHGWFVENCQNGEDNCREHYVSREQLETLRDLCKDILEHPDAERDSDLEPKEGFFFGSYEKDEWYYQDLEDTVKGLERALTLSAKQYEFYYSSSW
jgi:hypothetical protein